MSEPIYIVSGFPRSGTSMMMRALEAGGIPCVYSTRGDEERNRRASQPGYVPNPHGFYENAELWNVDWSSYRGKAVKVIHGNLHTLPKDERLRIVYMRRDPAEIRQSARAIGEPHAAPNDYESLVAKDLVGLPGAVVLDYQAVIANPTRELSRLGWPLNLPAAAATITPALYRWRAA